MNEKNDEKPTIEVTSDVDWKEKVKSEDAKLDAERKAAAAETASRAASGEPLHLPPVNFAAIVQIFSTQAMAALGVLPGPNGEATQELPVAKYFIDLLGTLKEKTKSNLTGHESNLLESQLHELRLAYMELSKAPQPGSDES